MSNLTPDPKFNPFAAPAVAAEASPQQPWIHLAQYRTVRLGLQLIYYSIATMAGMMILFATCMFVFGAANGTGLGAAALFGFSFFAALILSCVGVLMCGACPNPNEKTLAFTTILCLVVYIVTAVISSVIPVYAIEEAGMFFSSVISLVGNIAYIACTILFCLLLKRIGSNISSELLKRKAHSTLILNLVLIGCSLLFVVAMVGVGFSRAGSGFAGLEIFGGVFVLIMLVVGLVTFFQYLAMLRAGISELNPNRNVKA